MPPITFAIDKTETALRQTVDVATNSGDLKLLPDGRAGSSCSLETIPVGKAGMFETFGVIGLVAAASALVLSAGTEVWGDPTDGLAKPKGAVQSVAGAIPLGTLARPKANGETEVLVVLNQRKGPVNVKTELGRPTHTAATGEVVMSTARIPAPLLTPGSVIDISALVKAPATNSTDTFQYRVRLNSVTGPIVWASNPIDLANNNFGLVNGKLTVLTDGETGTVSGAATGVLLTTAAHGHLAAEVIDTTEDLLIVFTAQHSTSNAGNTSQLEQFVVDVIG